MTAIQEQVPQMVNLFVVDTLEYLQKGGRLSAGEAFIGNLLSIKPIITIEEGKLKSLDKVRGRKKQSNGFWIIFKMRNIDLSEKLLGFSMQMMKHIWKSSCKKSFKRTCRKKSSNPRWERCWNTFGTWMRRYIV